MIESKQKLNVHIRWMIRRDLNQVCTIENFCNFDSSCKDDPWCEEDFILALRQKNVIGMVAEADTMVTISGFMLYELGKESLDLWNFNVNPLHKRQGVGAQMIQRLKDKLTHEGRSRISIEVPESNLDAQLFFRSQGFFAERIIRDEQEDYYEFVYRLNSRIGGRVG